MTLHYDQVHRDYCDAWRIAQEIADSGYPAILQLVTGQQWRVTTDPLAAFEDCTRRVFRPSQIETVAAAGRIAGAA